MKSTRDIGKLLENYVLTLIQKIDPKARLTKGSGSATELGDILNTRFFVECKKRNKKNFTVDESVWIKLLELMPYKTQKFPLYVIENENKRRFAVLDLDDFFRLITEMNQ